MFAANPSFARGESRIPFDMLNPFAGFKFFTFQTTNPKTLNLRSKSLRIGSVFLHSLVTSISYCLDVLFECGRAQGLEGTCLFN